MSNAVMFLTTLLAGFALGFLLYRLKIPGGMLIGSLLGAAILNIVFDAAYVPLHAKTFAQITAGAFIGTSVNRSDLFHLRKIYKPSLILIGMHLFCNLLLGTIIYLSTSLDPATAYFSAVPGGISDIPLVAADMGASAAKVTVIQFVRMVVATGIFPGMIDALCKNEERVFTVDKPDDTADAVNDKFLLGFMTTLAVALISGVLGFLTGIPAGALVFSMLGIIALNLLWGRVYMPMWLKRLAQVLSGAYIGCSVSNSDLLELQFLIFPAILLVLGYSINCFFSGWLLRRFCAMGKKESLLAAIPAGASDMALISMDMGVQSTDLVVLQILRLVAVSSVFPQIIRLVLWLCGCIVSKTIS